MRHPSSGEDERAPTAVMVDWAGIDVAWMDCETDNLAVLLRFHGATDVLAPFGCQWHLATGPAGDLVLDRLPTGELMAGFCGLVPRAVPTPAEAVPEACRERLAAGRPVLVYGDAYFLPWLPYVGAVHMEHTFLVTGVAADGRTYGVADAYDNPTQWGPATPVRSHLDHFGLVRAVAALETAHAGWLVDLEPAPAARPPDHRRLLADNGRAVAAATAAGTVAAYAERCGQRLDDPEVVAGLTLTCWLAHRRRALHARWLAELEATEPWLVPEGFSAAFARDVADGWRRARDFSYVAQRRAEHGKRVPPTALDLLAGEVEPAAAAAADELLAHLAGAPAPAGGGRA